MAGNSGLRERLVPLLAVGVLAVPVASTVVAAPAFATGNNGTIKVHALGSEPGSESNEPKVCAFNLEFFGFDEGTDGYVTFEVQGGDGPTGVAAGPFEEGPADADGYFESEYFNVADGPVIENGHYKVTLFGKFNDGKPNYEDIKAKSKVFKVECTPQPPDKVEYGQWVDKSKDCESKTVTQTRTKTVTTYTWDGYTWVGTTTTTTETQTRPMTDAELKECAGTQPPDTVTYSEWKDVKSDCESKTVTQTRTKTVTTWKWDGTKYVSTTTTTTETRTRPMTEAELKECTPPVVPPVPPVDYCPGTNMPGTQPQGTVCTVTPVVLPPVVIPPTDDNPLRLVSVNAKKRDYCGSARDRFKVAERSLAIYTVKGKRIAEGKWLKTKGATRIVVKAKLAPGVEDAELVGVTTFKFTFKNPPCKKPVKNPPKHFPDTGLPKAIWR